MAKDIIRNGLFAAAAALSLAGAAPAAERPAMTRHVVLIGLDGAQYSRILSLHLFGDGAAQMPLEHREGFTGGVAPDLQPTLSGPGWVTTLTGQWSTAHHVMSNHPGPIPDDVNSVFRQISIADPKAIEASICAWPNINLGFFINDLQSGAIQIQATGLSDDQVIATTVGVLDETQPVFTFVHLDSVDETGHAEGFGADYDKALHASVVRVRRVLAEVAKLEGEHPGEQWLVLVATDHGRDAAGRDHGKQSATERQIFVAANRALATESKPFPQIEIAPTILRFLGVGKSDAATLLAHPQ